MPDRMPSFSVDGYRRYLSRGREYGIVISVVALVIVLSVSSNRFLSVPNLLNILEQSAAVGIVACGATVVIISRGFDLSVGAIYALSGVIAAQVAVTTGAPLGILAGLLAGSAVGAVNGALVAVGRINSFVATLASSFVVRGLAVLITGGLAINVTDGAFGSLGQGDILGVRVSIWLFALFAALCGIVLRFTNLGRYIYAIGGNPEAARLAGVRVEIVQVAAFTIGGLAAGLAGIISASRIGTGLADAGIGIELTAIAAVTIGGTSIQGGEGAIWRTILGVLLLGLLTNGFTLLGVDPSYQPVIQGLIIVFAVAADVWGRRR